MSTSATLVKFSIFSVICLAFTGWLVVVIGNVSFEPRHAYAADFANVQGLLVNDDVKIAGVTLGKVTEVEHLPGGMARVHFTLRDDVPVPEGSTVSVRWRDVFGLRFLYVEPGDGEPVEPGHVFPRDRTRAPADLNVLLQRLTPFIEALNPELQNQILQALSDALVGREAQIQQLIADGAQLTQAIASRDQQIESLLVNTETILAAYADREQELRGLLESFAEVSSTLRERNDELERAIVSLADGQTELRRFVEANEDEIRGTLDALEAITEVLAPRRDRLAEVLESTPRGLVGYHLISSTGQWFNIRSVGVSVADSVVTTERGAGYPRPDGSESTGTALSELLGGGL